MRHAAWPPQHHMLAFGKKSESYVQVHIPEARFTVSMVKLHKVYIEVSANGQRFTSRATVPGPADAVSHRFKCGYNDVKVTVPLLPWDGPPLVKVALWDKSIHRRTCLGSVEISVNDILTDSSAKSYSIPSTLFPSLNAKFDVNFQVHGDTEDLEAWAHLYAPPFTEECESTSDPEAESVLSSMSDLSNLSLSGNESTPTDSTDTQALPTDLKPPPASFLAPDEPNLGRKGSRISLRSFISGKSSKKRTEHDSSSSHAPSRIPRRHRKGDNFAMDVDSTLEGIVYLEIVGARNLPRFRTLTGLSFDMDPFVVISFGRRNFKTSYRRHTTNPTFNQNLLLLIDKHELNYDIDFTVWDKDRITLNDRVGRASINVSDIRKVAPDQFSNGIYDLESYTPQSTVLPLEIFDAAQYRTRGKDSSRPELMINVHYLPFPAVRQQMWRGLISMYDGDESGCLNRDALTAMLKSIGSNLTEDSINCYFGSQKTLTTDEIVCKLEEQLKTDENKPSARIISFRVCPVCQIPRLGNFSEKDSLRHISFCASRQWSGTNAVLLDDRYVTSAQASRRWYTKFLSKFSYGSYQLGANNANILVQDRISGQIHEEKMSTYVRLGIRILYAAGPTETRRMRKLLKKYTLKQGIKFDSPSSASSILPFVKFHRLDMTDVKLPVSEFKTFNEFFYRELKPGSRIVENTREPRTAVSLADCRLTAFPTIDEATQIWIKGKTFSIENLLGPTYPEDAHLYDGGSLVIFRLAPQDYHRFHIPVDGVLGRPKHIEGEYYTVNPMAIRSPLDVYGLNARTVVPIDSDKFGRVMIVLVGAMMVGAIEVTAQEGSRVKRGDELGYFKFGGSTCVVLFEPGKIVFDQDLVNNSKSAIETLVRVGMSIGHSPKIPEYTRVYDTRRITLKRAETTIAGGGSYMPFSLD